MVHACTVLTRTSALWYIVSRAVVRFKYQGALVSRAPNKPKYKPGNIEKIKSHFTDQTSITECIELYRLAPMGTTVLVLSTTCETLYQILSVTDTYKLPFDLRANLSLSLLRPLSCSNAQPHEGGILGPWWIVKGNMSVDTSCSR